MALIDIEYGSLASSETMNKNFTYLDEKIAESNESIMTSISSILSNIATINARLNDMSENFDDSLEVINTTIDENKSKLKLMVNKTSMVPDWSNCISIGISSTTKYTAPSNGYLLLISATTTSGHLIVNGKSVSFKKINGQYDNAAQLVSIPVKEGDIAYSTCGFDNAYFLPALELSIENT